MNKKLARYFITVGPIGYLFSSGTIAAVVTIMILLLFSLSIIGYIGVMLAMIVIAWRAIIMVCDHSTIMRDPSEIVIDEVIGTMVTFCGIPLTLPNIVCGFFLFRFLDITKIGLIRSCEKVTNGWGILLDDIVAGIIANIIVRIMDI